MIKCVWSWKMARRSQTLPTTHGARRISLLTLRLARKITQKENRLNVAWCKRTDFQRQLPLICIPNLSCFTCEDIDWIRPRGSLIRMCRTESRKTCLCLVMSERERNFISLWFMQKLISFALLWAVLMALAFVDSSSSTQHNRVQR